MTMQAHQTAADPSPFHAGEKAIQERVGVRESMETFGRRVIRSFMPQQHRDFFEALPYIGVGHVDQDGWPWASMLVGKPGFIKSPDDRHLDIEAEPAKGDPLADALRADTPVGLLGVEFSSRRRNRVNAHITATDRTGISLEVDQSFGNCPQYIQSRALEFVRDPSVPSSHAATPLSSLDDEARDLIERSDTFLVASAVARPVGNGSEGVDVSHRGGRPGFVRVDGNRLTIPDYTGNFHFNTLGNFLVNPRAGLLFIDFSTGEMLLLTGRVEMIWDGPEVDAFAGAERAWTFELDHGVRLVDALPIRWSFEDYSLNTLITGTWEEADARLAAEARRNEWRDYKIVRVEDESELIRSFYLEPADGAGLLDFRAGQFLTIRAEIPGMDRPTIRTYTVSSGPADTLYRISVKREAARPGGDEPGLMSNYLHEVLQAGDRLQARAPTGEFTIDASVQRPAVLLAGGVGITPMISMARHLAFESVRTRHSRPVTLIHSAQNSGQRAFFEEATRLAEGSNGQMRYVSLINRASDNEREGVDYHGRGRITADILRSVLGFDDHDFYLCGPPPFMQGLYDVLRGMGVRDKRIFAEAFGPASMRRRPDGDAQVAADVLPVAKEALVKFETSNVEQRWTQNDGNLLELAESHGLTPAYGCRSGACGSCAVKLNSGSVTYTNSPTAKVSDGEALICCAQPAEGGGDIVLEL
jgi:ferredoxin-NADP reductase/predicted pyridoxine 5'-phosphate oxidase superfamily flavin-nucleotide-binding protein